VLVTLGGNKALVFVSLHSLFSRPRFFLLHASHEVVRKNVEQSNASARNLQSIVGKTLLWCVQFPTISKDAQEFSLIWFYGISLDSSFLDDYLKERCLFKGKGKRRKKKMKTFHSADQQPTYTRRREVRSLIFPYAFSSYVFSHWHADYTFGCRKSIGNPEYRGEYAWL
jgi:hypothetical protein